LSDDFLSLGLTSLRGTDSNSLLRFHDRAFEIFTKSASQQEREKAGRIIARIAKELRRRQAP